MLKMSIASATHALRRVIQFLTKWMKSPSVNVDEAGCEQHVHSESVQGVIADETEAETLTNEDTVQAETLANVLPNEILLSIFSFLQYEDLISAEQVCKRWQTVVETCFATEKRLDLRCNYRRRLRDGDNHINCGHNRILRYGSSIRTLRWSSIPGFLALNTLTEEIADRFPNLLTLELQSIDITNDDFTKLSTKCCQLENVSLRSCDFDIEGLRIFLQALPGIKFLDIDNSEYDETGMCINGSAVFSTCRNLHTFELSFDNLDYSDKVDFSRFCKECVTLRKLCIQSSEMTNEMFAQIQHCLLLEELQLFYCEVDDSSLIEISKGCPNLRSVSFYLLPLTSDEGLKSFARCRNLNEFWAYKVEMTDETLVELSKCVDLRELATRRCPLVSDRGCARVLANCPRLKLLYVEGCEGVSNATVDSAIEAVKSRQNGLILELKLRDTSVTPEEYGNCHPLLRLSYDQ